VAGKETSFALLGSCLSAVSCFERLQFKDAMLLNYAGSGYHRHEFQRYQAFVYVFRKLSWLSKLHIHHRLF